MPRLNRAARDQAFETMVTLTRCWLALRATNAPTPETRRYIDRIDAIAKRFNIKLTPSMRAALVDQARAENDARGTMDLHS